MFPNNLTTNEVKDSAGVEVEFLRIASVDRSLTFAKSGESPNAPHRIKISHLETGSGASTRRRSVVRVDKTITGVSLAPRTVSAYVVVDAPIGDISATTDIKDTIANLLSLVASTGATTTILYDCTGYGADALTNGSL